MISGQVQSASALAEKVSQDPELQARIKADPVSAINSLVGPVYQTDIWIYRMVVGALGLVVIIAIIGAIIITLSGTGDKKVPDVLTALGSAAIGALAGLLAPSPAPNKT